MLIVNWEQTHQLGPEMVGGKGWNLGRLIRYGFAVPEGGVITAEAYRLFIAEPSLRAAIESLNGIQATEIPDPSVMQSLANLRAQMVNLPLPPSLVTEITAFLQARGLIDRPLAVRSSATAEDSAAASFAGIHQSFLGLTGPEAVAQAVGQCYASLWTPQAVAYRRRLGLADNQVAAAVVILEMVPARAAGVAFSCDPKTGRLDRHAISASIGLGEAVVSGLVQPDQFLIDISQYPPTLIKQQIGSKEQKVVLSHDGGTGLLQTPPEQANQPSLTALQLQELSLLVGRIHDSLGWMEHPQDIEWAHDGQQFWLLQARPVTHLPTPTFSAIAEQPVIWSNANLKDVMPGLQSALGWSSMRSGIDILLAAPLSAAGYPHADGLTWARLYQGRAYFNLSAMQWAFYDALGIMPAELNRMLGGHQPAIAVPSPTLVQGLRRRFSWLKLVRKTAHIMKKMPAEFQRLWRWAEESEARSNATAGANSINGWSNHQLLCKSLALKAEMERFLPRFNLVNGAAGGIHQELVKLLQPAFGLDASGLVNAMLVGSSNVTSAQQGLQLIALGNSALAEERTRCYFESVEFDPRRWRAELTGTRFLAAFEQYLREYGHRGVYELEPMNPRWQEDPTYLLQTIQAQVCRGQELHLPDQAPKREAARRKVFAQIGFGPRRLKLRYFLKQAAEAASQREMAKSVLVKAAGLSRYIALEVGRKMANRGLIADPTDIFHLSWLDQEAFLQERAGLHGFKSLVADRKAQREQLLRLTPPDVIQGEKPMPKAAPAAPGQSMLIGTGVASGTATGLARIIMHPHEGHHLQPGEILVAPSTDPAWTPLFLRTAAIVMEVGGYLSHGAIVAREYGLPAVVNIPGLLSSIQDGQEITVDGDDGKVYLGRRKL